MALIVVMQPLGYELVATDRSNLVASLMARAVALAEQNQLKLARLHFLRALELDEGSAVAHNGLAIVLARQGDLVGAAKHFERALAIDPDHPVARQNLQHIRKALQQSR